MKQTSGNPATKGRGIRWTLAGLLALVAGGLTMPASAQEDISDAREKRDRARAEQAAAAERLELLEAEDDAVAAALGDMQLAVDNQTARVEAARSYLQSTRREAKRLREELEAIEIEVELSRDVARAQAIEAFIGVGAPGADYWLTDADPSRAARMLEMLRVTGHDQYDAIDSLRALELRQDVLIEAAAEAAREATEAKRALEDELEEQQRRLDIQIGVQAELQVRIGEWEAQVAAFEAEEAELTEFIKEEQRKALGSTEHTPGAASLEGFIKPVAGAVGSGFGPRVHPIYGTTRMHNGVDMGGAMGDPIWASKDGVVIDAGWNGGYGNAVVIDHGDGIATLYAHQSELFVSTGDSVSQGETIGAVGSTGLSTGPHLHFEVRVNGDPVDPVLFLP